MGESELMIAVRCRNPKKIAEEYRFDSFENFALWITRFTREGKNVGPMCHKLAEQGTWNESVYAWNIEATTDITFDYFTLRDVAEKVGLLKTKNIRSNPYKREPEIGLNFARAVDALR